MLLVVRLASSYPALAEAALGNGADALCLATASRPSVAASRQEWERVIQMAGERPCGLAFEPSAEVTTEVLAETYPLGFDFVSCYAHQLPVAALGTAPWGRIATVDHSYSPELLRSLSDLPVDAVELATAAEKRYGQPLSLRDLMGYHRLVQAVRKPVLLLAQLALRPEDIASLHELGIEGLVLTPTLAGGTAESLAALTAAFRRAIDTLPRGRGRLSSDVVLPSPGGATRHGAL